MYCLLYVIFNLCLTCIRMCDLSFYLRVYTTVDDFCQKIFCQYIVFFKLLSFFFSQLLVIDISSTIQEKENKASYLIDYPVGVTFSPAVSGSQVVVITSKKSLMKFDSKSGQLLSEVSQKFYYY